MNKLAASLAELLDVGRYISSIAKALDDVGNYRTHAMQRGQAKQYFELSREVLRNLDHMIYERMFVERELRYYLQWHDQLLYQSIVPHSMRPDKVESVRTELEAQVATILDAVSSSIGSIAEFIEMTRDALPGSPFGLEMKRLMMATEEINSYLMHREQDFHNPTPEFIAQLRDLHYTYGELQGAFSHMLSGVDKYQMDRAFFMFTHLPSPSGSDA
jgi:hypothetical protein